MPIDSKNDIHSALWLYKYINQEVPKHWRYHVTHVIFDQWLGTRWCKGMSIEVIILKHRYIWRKLLIQTESLYVFHCAHAVKEKAISFLEKAFGWNDKIPGNFFLQDQFALYAGLCWCLYGERFWKRAIFALKTGFISLAYLLSSICSRGTCPL